MAAASELDEQPEFEILPDPDEVHLQEDRLIEGLHRKVLNGPADVREDLGDCYPKKGALVEVRVKGLCNGEEIYPTRDLKFFIGDGVVENLPIGLDVALVFFLRGETALITITDSKLLLPTQKENEYIYYVTLKRFENLPECAQDLSLVNQVTLCSELRRAGAKLFDHKLFDRAAGKYKLIRQLLSDTTLCVREIPPAVNENRLDLLFQANMGLAKSLSEMQGLDFKDADKFKTNFIDCAEDALKIQPKSIEANQFIGKYYMSINEPQKALKYFLETQNVEQVETDDKKNGIMEDIICCQNMIQAHKEQETKLAMNMLRLT